MKVLFHSTNRSQAGYLNVGPIMSDKFQDVNLSKIHEPIEEVYCDNIFCFFDIQKARELLEIFYKRLEPNGLLTIICDDVYQLVHLMHRRTITEPEFNATLFKNGAAKNCVSTLFFIQICGELGFKKEHISFEGTTALIRFRKI